MVLVTGGTGLVGAHLLFDLINSGKHVRAIKRSGSNLEKVKKTFAYYSKNHQDLFSKIEWMDADILDYSSLLDAMENIETVYHAAAIVSFAPSDKYVMLKNNIEGTANVVNACLEKNIEKLCYVSSIAAVGSSVNGELINEEMKWVQTADTSNYSYSKYFSELEVWRGVNEGLNAVIVNPTVILGPADWSKGSSALFNTVFKGLKYYSLGGTGFVDVRDVSGIMIQLMNSKISGERYILNSENVDYRILLNSIAEALLKEKPRVPVTNFLANIAWRLEYFRSKFTGRKPLITKETTISAQTKKIYSNEKIRKELNYKFISVADSVKDTCEKLLFDFRT